MSNRHLARAEMAGRKIVRAVADALEFCLLLAEFDPERWPQAIAARWPVSSSTRRGWRATARRSLLRRRMRCAVHIARSPPKPCGNSLRRTLARTRRSPYDRLRSGRTASAPARTHRDNEREGQPAAAWPGEMRTPVPPGHLQRAADMGGRCPHAPRVPTPGTPRAHRTSAAYDGVFASVTRRTQARRSHHLAPSRRMRIRWRASPSRVVCRRCNRHQLRFR